MLYLCDVWKSGLDLNSNVSESLILKNGQFILSTSFSVSKISPLKDSVKSQLLRLYSQFLFLKILRALQFFTLMTFWKNVLRPS